MKRAHKPVVVFLLAVFSVFFGGCDLIEQADQIKERVDNADYELKRAVEEEVEKKLDEKVNELREEGADKKMIHKAMGKEPTGAGAMSLRNGKKVRFKSILNFRTIIGKSSGKDIVMPVDEVSEIVFLSSDRTCGVPEPRKGKVGGKCRLRVQKSGEKSVTIESAVIVLHDSGRKLDQCEYLAKVKGSLKSPEKTMGMSRIKSIDFEK